MLAQTPPHVPRPACFLTLPQVLQLLLPLQGSGPAQCEGARTCRYCGAIEGHFSCPLPLVKPQHPFSIHFTWNLGVSRESRREMGPECDFNPFLKCRETPHGISQCVVLFSSYSQAPFKASAKKLMGSFCTALGRQVDIVAT